MHAIYYIAKSSFYMRILAAFALIILFYILKKTIIKLILRLFSKIKFKNYSLDYKLTDALGKPLDYFWTYTGLYLAICISPFVTYTFIPNSMLWFIDSYVSLAVIPFSSLTKLYTVFAVIICTWGIYNLEFVYEEFFTQLNTNFSLTDNTLLIRFSAKIIRFFTVIVGIFIVLSLFIKDIAGIVTGVGLGSVAFAFVTKDALSNILSGALLMIDKPFVIGDWIQVDDLEGTVEDISFRSTRIRTFTQGVVMIPNSKVSSENIINWSKMQKRRVKFDLLLDYHTPISKIHTCMDKIKCLLASHPSIEDGSFIVRLESIGIYALQIQIIYFSLEVEYSRFLEIKESANLQMLDMFAQEEVKFAFPTQTVITHQANL